jgi:hypothetical protein
MIHDQNEPKAPPTDDLRAEEHLKPEKPKAADQLTVDELKEVAGGCCTGAHIPT